MPDGRRAPLLRWQHTWDGGGRVGRHSRNGAAAGSSPQGAELLGWGLFTLVLTVGVMAWLDIGWLVVGGVGAVLVLGIGVVWLAVVVSGTGREAAGERRDPTATGAGDDSGRD